MGDEHMRGGKVVINKHIELVKRWLDDPESVTQEELDLNADAASAAAAAWAAADTAAARDAENSAYWVKRYEELTDDDGLDKP